MENIRHCTKIVWRATSVEDEKWQHFKFHFNEFESLASVKGQVVMSPEVTCFGKQWRLAFYPGGSSSGEDGKVSLFLNLCSTGCSVNIDYQIKIGKINTACYSAKTITFGDRSLSRGWDNIATRSEIIDPSNKHMLVNGTLSIEVSMKLNNLKEKPRRCTEIVCRETPAEDEKWQHFKFHFNEFESLASVKGQAVESPQVTCFGKQWQLRLYPRGTSEASDGHVSLFLDLCSNDCSVNIDYQIKIGNMKRTTRNSMSFSKLGDEISSKGWYNLVARSFLINPSNGVLENGTLNIEVYMKLKETKSLPFIPENPLKQMILKLRSDKSSADVLFTVEKTNEKDGSSTAKSSPVCFHAHRFVLQLCAPSLAALVEPYEDLTPLPIPGVSPDIFRHLLNYVYGGKIPPNVFTANAKDLMDAADQFGVVNLKLEAEVRYVRSTTFTLENVNDNLNYAISKNCAYLQEMALDFIVEHDDQYLENKSSRSGLAGELLSAYDRKNKKKAVKQSNESSKFSTPICTLRREVHERGLDTDIDGSRETLYTACLSGVKRKRSGATSDES